MKSEFFLTYFSRDSYRTLPDFERAVRQYQEQAIRLFSTFSEAYRVMNGPDDLVSVLKPLESKSVHSYRQRTSWEGEVLHPERNKITVIEERRLPYLGYISAAMYKEQLKKREVLAKELRSLAESIRVQGNFAVQELSVKKKRKLDSLLRELDSTLQHTPLSPLFIANPEELESEAARILRHREDESEMEQTQSEALKNLSNYVSADFMDVYVATSMRTDSDFISVSRFVSALFQHNHVEELKLRYFNPTQSWIDDRVAKGLVEALMLRRANCTIYMAQKSDTFGKDSEASVALGQGKPVIVYVPKLVLKPFADYDSDELLNLPESRLIEIIRDIGGDQEVDETLDKDGLFAEALKLMLNQLTVQQLSSLVDTHWADFGLLDESERIKGDDETLRREQYTTWVRKATGSAEFGPLNESLRQDLVNILTGLTVNFEKRARLFRVSHPLALQVILSSGVLNGILVSRSVDSCARLLRAIIENKLDLKLHVEPENYKLIEETTGSTIRVISRNNLLVNAFDAYYDRL